MPQHPAAAAMSASAGCGVKRVCGEEASDEMRNGPGPIVLPSGRRPMPAAILGIDREHNAVGYSNRPARSIRPVRWRLSGVGTDEAWTWGLSPS